MASEGKKYQLVVIGGGPGGYEGAIRAAQLGLKTALVEARQLGGTCLNRGCIPTKTLMHGAQAYSCLQHFPQWGLQVQGASFAMPAMQRRRRQVVEQLGLGIQQLLQANGVDVYQGWGFVPQADQVQVLAGGMGSGAVLASLKTEKILVATGAKPLRPAIPGLDLQGVMTSDDLLDQSAGDRLYDPLVIIGGGVIGVEMATIYRGLGCQVSLLEAMPRLLPTLDREISQNLTMILKKRGIGVHTQALVTEIQAATQGTAGIQDQGLMCRYNEKGQQCSLPAQGILVAIGRQPVTEGLFGADLQIQRQKGWLVVDEDYQTNIPGIYGVGDVIGGLQLAHCAGAEGLAAVAGMVAAKNGEAVAGGGRTAHNKLVIPSCVYTDPEIASVGLDQESAKAKGIGVKVGKCLMSANGKSLIENQERGFIKLVFDAQTEVLLGAQLMCARATDLISELTTAVVNGLTKTQLAAVIRPHPTFAEAITEAVESLDGRAIHLAPKK